MALREELHRSGNWLFRWRSYVPLLLIVPTFAALRHFKLPFHSGALQEAWEIVCLSVSLVGLGVRILTVGYVPHGTSGRNTRRQMAAVLNTTGMYSIVRHPLYLGNFLIWLGISMFSHCWWLVAIFALAFCVYYERIIFAEEEFLRDKFKDGFLNWANRTPALIPRFSQWQRPSLPFSLRTVLKREYPGFLALVAVFFFMDLYEDSLVRGKLTVEPFCEVLAILALGLFLTLRTIKRRTTLLDVEDR